MKHLGSLCRNVLLGSLTVAALPLMAQTKDRGFYATVYAQSSRLGATHFDETGNAGLGTGLRADFSNGTGFGGDIGFRYGNGWAAEFEWNYRRHDLKSLRTTGSTTVSEGDYASNIFFINGLRRFVSPAGGWTPYVGAGLGWVQEIDFDLNSGSTERAWSKQGKFGVQLIGGTEIPLGKDWRLAADIRVLRVGGVTLPAEQGVQGSLAKPRYNPVSVQLGLRRMF